MNASERKQQIIEQLDVAEEPIKASQLAEQLGVSRQIIVGDIAILRASGKDIIATPRGYLLQKEKAVHYSIACCHNADEMQQELYAIVDNGCSVIDVIVEHQVYGQLVGDLHIFSRKDADEFIQSLQESNQEPLSSLTEHIHLHTVDCPSQRHYEELKKDLQKKGFLISQ
ncbi:MAG: transcription repressor NadR [Eubacteriales bacterium]